MSGRFGTFTWVPYGSTFPLLRSASDDEKIKFAIVIYAVVNTLTQLAVLNGRVQIDIPKFLKMYSMAATEGTLSHRIWFL